MDGSVNEQGALPMRQILWLCDKPLLDHLATPRPLRTPREEFHHRGTEAAKGFQGIPRVQPFLLHRSLAQRYAGVRKGMDLT